ncbi:MAG TPA: MotA/TolQ/ExbB proton channel family protein [Candidatus Sabulitectum sp.]|nr:MotA/TolQ/ExbB proton channel family protein [Candidatus Sabulitectum sp.]HPJ27982.1 MotA/TolQ/ExbB proton channel family protein [Candidatus Sabulitectum sp.]HPR21785.1 MotA/TolQ/ExbB proton channel family protein [Candidatus Sabulitectum sp.]
MLGQVWSTVAGSDGFTKFILLLILVLSLGSWGVAIAKLRELTRIMNASRKFMDALRTTGRPPGGDFVKHSGDMGPLARMYTEAGRYLRRRQDQGRTEPLNRDEVAILHGALEREASEDLAQRSRNIGFLATVTSVSPLLGLLGTVWGVLVSFIGMREAGIADISAVGSGVAAALTTTVAGLLAAIPANVFHNYVVGRVDDLAGEMDRFLSELVDVCRRGSIT